eukprot:6202902-Pleurochrysis_carterae.AAC.1
MLAPSSLTRGCAPSLSSTRGLAGQAADSGARHAAAAHRAALKVERKRRRVLTARRLRDARLLPLQDQLHAMQDQREERHHLKVRTHLLPQLHRPAPQPAQSQVPRMLAALRPAVGQGDVSDRLRRAVVSTGQRGSAKARANASSANARAIIAASTSASTITTASAEGSRERLRSWSKRQPRMGRLRSQLELALEPERRTASAF